MGEGEGSARLGSVTEAELRAEVVRLAHVNGWKVFSLPIAKTRRPVKDAVGYPDLTLARAGRVLWIELKTDDGNLSRDQMLWLRELSPYMVVIRPCNMDSVGTLLA